MEENVLPTLLRSKSKSLVPNNALKSQESISSSFTLSKDMTAKVPLTLFRINLNS